MAVILVLAFPTVLSGCSCLEQPEENELAFVGVLDQLENSTATFVTGDDRAVGVYVAGRPDVLRVGQRYEVVAYGETATSRRWAYLGQSQSVFGSCPLALDGDDSIHHADGSAIDTRVVTNWSTARFFGVIALFVLTPLVLMWAVLTAVRRLVRGRDDGYVDL